MNPLDDELINAEIGSEDARQRLARTAAALHTRLKPSELVNDAAHELKKAGSGLVSKGLTTVTRNPVAALGVIAALGAFLGRKPLARLFRRRLTRA